MQTFSYPQTVSARELQRNYLRVINTAKRTKQPVVILTNNKPQGMVISMATYNDLIGNSRQKLLNIFNTIGANNQNLDPDAVMNEINEDVAKARTKLYVRNKARS